MTSLEKAKLCMQSIEERKAVLPVLLRIGERTSIADYFLIAGGHSTTQVQAMARHLERQLRKSGLKPYGTEGEEEGRWILLDYGDLVVHLFFEPVREFYDLEGFWADVPRIYWKDGHLEEETP